jgi:hypothetical protein
MHEVLKVLPRFESEATNAEDLKLLMYEALISSCMMPYANNA